MTIPEFVADRAAQCWIAWITGNWRADYSCPDFQMTAIGTELVARINAPLLNPESLGRLQGGLRRHIMEQESDLDVILATRLIPDYPFGMIAVNAGIGQLIWPRDAQTWIEREGDNWGILASAAGYESVSLINLGQEWLEHPGYTSISQVIESGEQA